MFQPEVVRTVAANVIPFMPRQPDAARLSMRDRMDVALWQETAHRAGYDRLVIHERGPFDPPEMHSFLGIYKHGEAWSRWGIARFGASVTAWNSINGRDIGRFSTVAEALLALLRDAKPDYPACA